MKRFFGFLIRLAVFVALAVWLADQPGTARIAWHDYVVETSAAVVGLSALIVGFVFYLLFRFWRFLRYGPERWRMHKRMQKMRRGHDQLTEGLIAIAGGNAAEAGRHAVNARKLLGTTISTQLLQAQAAQLAGDHAAARDIFRSLAASADGAVLGYRGLIMEAWREQDWGEVRHLVERLQQTKPNTPWLNLVRFELLVRQEEWADANIALAKVSGAHLLDSNSSKQYRAAVLVAASQQEARNSFADRALQAAEQAAKHDANWLPGVINLARQQMLSGHRRASYRTVEKYWDKMPHPQLAVIYRAADTDTMDAYKRMERLCHENIDNPVSRYVLAETALSADIWGEARRHLISIITQNHATRSTYRMLARLERRQSGDEAAASQWLAKAVDAPADPVWLCHTCGGAHEDWQALCKHCHNFNTLDWQSPGISRAVKPAPSLLIDQWMD